MKLTEAQIQVLARLARVRDVPPTAPEISADLGHRTREWAGAKLAALHRKGLAEPLGHSGWTNARTWRITDAGREALARAEGRQP
jgi:hypothetical protein